MNPNIKEWIQYCTAVSMVISGMFLAFLSFFFNNYDIANGILVYIAQALVYAGGIFGVSLYFKTRMGELESKASITKEYLIQSILEILQDKMLIKKEVKDEIKTEKDQ